MKIRSGFVSNSSSNSYIIVGYITKEYPEGLEKAGWDIIYDEDIGHYVGRSICIGEYEMQKISLNKLTKMITEVKDGLCRDPEIYVGSIYR